RLRARERRAIARAHRAIAISAYTALRFREANPDVVVRSLVVCPLGIGPGPVRHEPSLEAGFALIVGRLWSSERYKGHDRLIDLWPSVQARVPDARLIVVGDGDDRRRLETRVAASGLDGAIRFVGRVSDEALAGLYRASAFFVMP